MWHGREYRDGMLHFGVRLGSKASHGSGMYQPMTTIYLNDFIIRGPPGSHECADNLDIIIKACSELGAPLAIDKLEGLASQSTFLGIEIGTQAGCLRLPARQTAPHPLSLVRQMGV